LHFSYLRFSFFSSCNNTKAADEKKVEKIAVVTVDTVKKKAINIIDTIDYNKRMQALSNNDTTGRWPVKWLIRYQAHYYPIIESSPLRKFIFHKDGNLRRNSKS
jgi:hypothetical protein